MFGFSGIDANGRQWSAQLPVMFNTAAPVPAVAGVSNAASGQQAYAPGMIMSIYGTKLASLTQAAAAVPLTAYLGDILIMFITGERLVSPNLATRDTPAPITPLSSLPSPRLPVKLSIGGADAPILFKGIPSGLVGVTQINFNVPPDAPVGTQQMVVTVGDASSAPVKFTVTQ